jgi:tetratricopeptide (TPR) repeat protein
MEKVHSKISYSGKKIRERAAICTGILALGILNSNTIRAQDSPAINQNVPVDTILRIEYDTEGPKDLPSQMEIRGKYEDYVLKLMNSVSDWLGMGDISKADPKRLSEAINKVDERSLFSYVSKVYHNDFGAYKEYEPLIDSIETKGFNCYSSSIIIADSLGRMGKKMDAVTAPGHVFLIGRDYAFETTTVEDPYHKPYFPRQQLSYEYPIHHEMGWNAFLAGAYISEAYHIITENQNDGLVEAYKNAINMDPDQPIINGVYKMAKMAAKDSKPIRFSHILLTDIELQYAQDEASKNPNNQYMFLLEGRLYKELGRKEESDKSFEQALEVYDAKIKTDPGNAELQIEKDELLGSLGRKRALPAGN